MKVSIVTACFNSVSTIRHTMDSVLRQSYAEIEYIVVDGRSTDGTVDLLRQYEAKFGGRMKWVSEKDNGIYDAMNKGLQIATGDVVGILNSDDWFTSGHVVARMVEAFDDDVDAVYGDVHFVRSGNPRKCVRYYSGRIFRPFMIHFGFIPPHPSFYIRRPVFDRYGGYNPHYRIAGDFELIARLLRKNRIRARYLHLDFVTMTLGGASSRNFQARIEGARESVRACKSLGLKTNRFMISLKYPIKIVESLLVRS